MKKIEKLETVLGMVQDGNFAWSYDGGAEMFSVSVDGEFIYDSEWGWDDWQYLIAERIKMGMTFKAAVRDIVEDYIEDLIDQCDEDEGWEEEMPF